MKNNIFTLLVIIGVAVGAFFAIHLQKKTSSSEAKAPESIQIGILGESRSDGSQDFSFNREVLTKLFKILNEHHVHTIFFTGNLTLGWSKLTNETVAESQKNKVSHSKDMFGNDWTAKGFFYDPIIFRHQLKQFYTFVNLSFNDPIAFYPLMGNHDAIGPKTSEIFRDELKLKDVAISANGQLRYTVSIGNAFFAMIPTNYYDPEQQQMIEHTITSDTISWLKTVLEQAKLNHRFLFVIGHEPAFSTPSIFNQPFGLDNHPEQRDAFWNVLKEYGVLAYFSSHEHVYDRSNRNGIWQIVSGGGGSPLNEGGDVNAFFHCLLLTIPQTEKGVPSVTVLDADGIIRDYFELNQEKQPLHQFRISLNYLKQILTQKGCCIKDVL